MGNTITTIINRAGTGASIGAMTGTPNGILVGGLIGAGAGVVEALSAPQEKLPDTEQPKTNKIIQPSILGASYSYNAGGTQRGFSKDIVTPEDQGIYAIANSLQQTATQI